MVRNWPPSSGETTIAPPPTGADRGVVSGENGVELGIADGDRCRSSIGSSGRDRPDPPPAMTVFGAATGDVCGARSATPSGAHTTWPVPTFVADSEARALTVMRRVR